MSEQIFSSLSKNKAYGEQYVDSVAGEYQTAIQTQGSFLDQL